jgi:hypothetical protein
VSLTRSRCHPAAGPLSKKPSSVTAVLSSRTFHVMPGVELRTPRRKLGGGCGVGVSVFRII